ncbi:MAG: isoprenylcysteine carboxylmethyltransferase family protein [Candidatus Omnitrophica bacterium]|nr:isoprenylcysteine carboxylmethyltransferase family protein [Candidatus Omnitrophota bacterium]
MKKRIKIDSALLSCIIIMTGFLFAFRNVYPLNPFLDDALDFLGFIVLLIGILLRMAARGHKKAHSAKSKEIVTSGPYMIVRNPMYLGSFSMGAGFILMLWPWWSLSLFAVLFYIRFIRQVVKEEEHLEGLRPRKYKAYCKKVPRIFPDISLMGKAKLKDVIDLKEAFSTKEARGLWGWPLLAVLLESFQEQLVFGETIPSHTIMIFLMAAIMFVVAFIYYYQKK